MIRGAHSINIDSKGRLSIPSRFRESIIARCNGNMIVTVNNTKEQCLWLFPMDEWENVEEKIVALPSFNSDHQKLKRFLLGHACDVEMDSSGRILIPGNLREFAMISKATMLVGQGNKFEIWSEDLWNARRNQWFQEESGSDNPSPEMERLAL